jgi:hypothetical protein
MPDRHSEAITSSNVPAGERMGNDAHPVAILLFAWLVMMPPIGNGNVYTNAPLATWQIVVEVSTRKDCEKVLLNYKKHPIRTSDPNVRKALNLRISKGTCISSDDPRLSK